MRKTFLFIIALVLLLAPAVFSQSRDTGAIRGGVTDDQNAPLPGVNVTLTGSNLMGSRGFVTDANGELRFPALPAGDYVVTVERRGGGVDCEAARGVARSADGGSPSHWRTGRRHHKDIAR